MVDNIAVAEGAEAEIFKTKYLGLDAIVKARIPKTYRHPELDRHIRLSRMRNEAHMMMRAREAGVRTPVIYDIDNDDCKLTMEYVEGIRIKEALDAGIDTDSVCEKIGYAVADMHNARLSHGDLTTSNMILTSDGRICIIDMSMGAVKAEPEDIGTDMRLLERAFASAHPHLDEGYRILLKAYCSRKTDADAVIRKVEEIKSRGRYT